MTRKGITAAALALAVTTTGLGGGAQAREIVWARDGDIDSLDPHRATSTLSRQLWYQIYDSLLEFDDNGQPTGNLARDWTVADGGRAVTFELHDDILCHDGTAFTAEDVKWTAERALSEDNPSITKASWGPITEVAVVDELTVRFHLQTPFAAFVPFMADPFTSMLCDSNAELERFGIDAAVGTGPWRFVDWTKGDEIVLARNEDYVNRGRPVENPGPPHAEQLIVRTMPEGQTRVAALRTGEVDLIVPPIEEVESLRGDPSFELHVAEGTGQNMFLEFAVSRPPFDDVRARRAIAHALDFEMALGIVFGDLVQRERCPVSRGVLGNDQDFCAQHAPQYDPQKARELLAELGYGPDNPMEVTLATWYGDNRGDMLQVFQNQLRQLGIDVGIEVMDIGTLNARVKQENNRDEGPGFIDLMGWTWFDPDVLYLLWHSPGAYEGYTDPELDELLEATRTTLDREEREAVVQDAFAHLLDNAVHVPVYTPGWLWMYAGSEDAAGFTIGPFNRPLFNDVGR